MRFRTVTELRCGGATKAELLLQLAKHHVQLNDYARALFASAEFATSTTARDVRLIQVSLPEIDLPNGGVYRDILARASHVGLEPCPLEVGPHLRLRTLDQLEGPYLTVASPEPGPDSRAPNGFYLRRHADGLWLRGYTATPDHLFPPGFTDFVFLGPES